MATLSVQEVDISGLEPSTQSAASGGDDAPNSGSMFLYVENTDTASHDVQPDDVGTTKYGKDIDPDPITVPAGSTFLIGPFPRDAFGASIAWTYPAGVTGLQVAAVRLTGVIPS